jgi:hypothetical protein
MRRKSICGAYARSTGKPCQAAGNGRGGRCRNHGGMSTGPRTTQGMRRVTLNLPQFRKTATATITISCRAVVGDKPLKTSHSNQS